MKLLLLRPNSWRRFGVSRVFTFWDHGFYSTETIRSSSSVPTDSLRLRISRAGHPTTSMSAILDQWMEEGRNVKHSELKRLIKQLRKHRRFGHALQVSQWMSDQNHDLSAGDAAIRLDLIAKVYGVEQADEYFNSIPDSLRTLQVYGALLNCYAHNKYLEKAEAIMEEIRDLGFAKTSLSYNVMLKLYYQLGKYEKLDVLLQEMEKKGINQDTFTFNIRLNAYGATSDIEGMEKILMKMQADPEFSMNWNTYVVAANWYLKAGLIEKGLAMVRKSEYLINSKTKRFAYETLLTLYTTAGNKDEVYRIWSLYRNLGIVRNSGYICMLSSLMKLDDVDGAERILEEWESEHTLFDSRVPNVMVSAYCRKGLLEKAEACVNRVIESGKDPDATTWDRLATGYYTDGQMGESAEIMKRAILACRPGWMPNRLTFASCLQYLKGQGDAEKAEELLSLLREQAQLPTGIYDQLVTYINNEPQETQALDEMEREENIIDVEMNEFIEFKDEGSI